LAILLIDIAIQRCVQDSEKRWVFDALIAAIPNAQIRQDAEDRLSQAIKGASSPKGPQTK
jgi:hypothetical protein